jgi:hypothetical protein
VPQKRTLAVTSPLGTPNPAGTNEYDYGTLIAASAAGSPAWDGSSLTRTACVGSARWCTGSPAVTNAEPGTNVAFSIGGAETGDWTRLDWVWEVQHFLSASSAVPEGSVAAAPGLGWRSAGESVTITAAPSAWGWTFAGWSGATNGADFPAAGAIRVSMDAPRDIVALLAEEAYAPRGTAISYLRNHGLTNPPYATSAESELGDPDLDSLPTWKEYVAGTDPTNALSVFAVLSIGHGSPSNRLVFFGTTNSGLDLPFGVYRSTNLLGENVWELLPAAVPRAADGTNVWWDTHPPTSTPAFYRPVATNAPPLP